MTSGDTFDLVIFDCDGVLIDSEALASRIDAEELTRLGYVISYEDAVARFTGLNAQDMRRAIEADWGPLPDDFDTMLQNRIKSAYRDHLRPIEGIAEVLRTLTIPRCVASSSAPDKLRLGLELTDLWHLLEPHVFSAALVKHGKPAPDLFLLAAERMGARPRRCVVVEDSIAGVRAGVAAGMTVIGFTGGGHCLADHAERLRDAGAAIVVPSATALSRLLLRHAPVTAVQ